MPLRFNLNPSHRLAAFFLLIYAGALLSLVLSNAPWWLKISAVFLVVFHGYYTIRKYALLMHPKAIVQCALVEDDLWLLIDRAGEEKRVRLLGDSWQSRYMLILNFRLTEKRKRISIVLISDMLDAAMMRRLRVYLNLLHSTCRSD